MTSSSRTDQASQDSWAKPLANELDRPVSGQTTLSYVRTGLRYIRPDALARSLAPIRAFTNESGASSRIRVCTGEGTIWQFNLYIVGLDEHQLHR